MSAEATPVPRQQDVALVDVLDRALAKGVTLDGDITIAVADVELIRIGLRALIAAVDTVEGNAL